MGSPFSQDLAASKDTAVSTLVAKIETIVPRVGASDLKWNIAITLISSSNEKESQPKLKVFLERLEYSS